MHRPTSIERVIRGGLAAAGVAFEPEHHVGRWSIDIYIPSASLAIECDGTYWHRRTSEREARRDKALLTKGIRTLRLAEEDILASPDACIQRIISMLSSIS